MAKINLLPWREELRKQRQVDFLIFLGLGVLVSIFVMAVVHFSIDGLIETQHNRNHFVQNEISVLDKRIKEIQTLDRTKSKLLARMEVIQRLQSSRPEIVHMFDQLAKTVPEGVRLTKFTQSGEKLSIEGSAQSNTRVSAYMRNLEQSPWLKGTDLNVIRSKGVDANSFTLKVVQAKVGEPVEGN
ncbi:MAG: type IV pilus assembly protein PilN [Cycloclasticus pugetii]|jgi:type IV pilus assembly protein PilN|uniref:Type IV pilus assembly protein PilN n=1 Tax=Cycloclasticus zancles 78-ME TaxID=1198232 RepID=S5TTS1_9GAMM|nr:MULTISPECIES: PilN domain-containing protein [Cycloclasticus]AGS38400.1 Type IV pilus assembly protein PilN [Cycloclasticus zancles 78-ME]MBV1897819.1 PilN domain-containing protein [Cycloclasticus sp.]PHR50246.1 MAG: pilus assembly protein PilN [Cycloclasticus sp.]SHJ23594.1 type IV pilus assembly protein PilN [Cycloclasticus pugetii]|tara:strand:+ start:2267 stop:2821 length:555 start_codon:yes stop_codon:yes gene_type:complete